MIHEPWLAYLDITGLEASLSTEIDAHARNHWCILHKKDGSEYVEQFAQQLWTNNQPKN